jgi:CspA family cold shock protein
VTELQRVSSRGGSTRTGTVTAFDESVGLGVVTGTDGVDHPFHCIEIADGSRSIPVGAHVTFDVLAKLGRWEAANLRT